MRLVKLCPHCGEVATSFSPSQYTPDQHYFCNFCESHYYNDRWWTEKEWKAYINSEEEVTCPLKQTPSTA